MPLSPDQVAAAHLIGLNFQREACVRIAERLFEVVELEQVSLQPPEAVEEAFVIHADPKGILRVAEHSQSVLLRRGSEITDMILGRYRQSEHIRLDPLTPENMWPGYNFKEITAATTYYLRSLQGDPSIDDLPPGLGEDLFVPDTPYGLWAVERRGELRDSLGKLTKRLIELAVTEGVDPLKPVSQD